MAFAGIVTLSLDAIGSKELAKLFCDKLLQIQDTMLNRLPKGNLFVCISLVLIPRLRGETRRRIPLKKQNKTLPGSVPCCKFASELIVIET